MIATHNTSNDAPLPPERGSSYAVMSQQSTLRSNNANISNIVTLTQPQSTSVKRVSFHDSNANVESMQRSVSSGNSSASQVLAMDVITEDPNVRLYIHIHIISEIVYTFAHVQSHIVLNDFNQFKLFTFFMQIISSFIQYTCIR